MLFPAKIKDLEADNGARDEDHGGNDNDGNHDLFDPVDAIWNRVIEVIELVVVVRAEVCLPTACEYYYDEDKIPDEAKDHQDHVNVVYYLSQVGAFGLDHDDEKEGAYDELVYHRDPLS